MAFVRRVQRCLRGMLRPRPLLEVERAFLEREFGDSLALDALRLAGGGQPTGRGAWQPLGALMQLDDACFEDADPRGPVRRGALPTLAHEALHVWQRRHRHCAVHVSLDGLWLGAFHGRRAYVYDRELRDPDAVLRSFRDANIECQGQMFEDYVRSNIDEPAGRDARFELVARYVRACGTL